jgi:hypothetical protein
MLTLDLLYSAAKNDVESYARCRADAVRRGAETPELAGLLTQKYGSGLAKALSLAAELADGPQPNLLAVVDQCVEAIDPNWRTAQQVRYTARPAGLSITPPAVGMTIQS